MSLASRKSASELIEHYRGQEWFPETDWYETQFLEAAENDNVFERLGIYGVLIAGLLEKARKADPATDLTPVSDQVKTDNPSKDAEDTNE